MGVTHKECSSLMSVDYDLVESGGVMTQGQSVVASDSVLDDFTIWCQHELFTPTMVRAAVLLGCACDLHLAQLYRSLDLARHLETPKTASELTSELGYVDSASIALEAMLLRLAHRSDVVRVDLQD